MRNFSFNNQIRSAIKDNIMDAWEQANPRPTWQGLPTVAQLEERRLWTQCRDEYVAMLTMVLSTFKHCEQLRDEWPDAEDYLPLALIKPSSVTLP